MTSIYLILNLFLLLIPIAFAFNKAVFTQKTIRATIPAVLISGIVFSALAVFYAVFKIWNFNSAYLIGLYFRELPLEQYLFNFTFTLAGVTIYNYLDMKFQKSKLEIYSLTISNLLLGVCGAFLFFTYMKGYAVVTFAILLLMLFHVEYLNKLRFMGKFYTTYVICLVPFYISNYIICNLNIVTYNQLESTRVVVFNIPIENHFYVMGMLLLAVFTLEFFKNKAKTHGTPKL